MNRNDTEMETPNLFVHFYNLGKYLLPRSNVEEYFGKFVTFTTVPITINDILLVILNK